MGEISEVCMPVRTPIFVLSLSDLEAPLANKVNAYASLLTAFALHNRRVVMG
jgi:hypothetical protein